MDYIIDNVEFITELVKSGFFGIVGILFRTGGFYFRCGDSQASYEYIMNIETRTSIS